MRAVYATGADERDPLAVLDVGERPLPPVGDGWVAIAVRAAALNRHDLWSLQGMGLPAERLPMILGCDAAGVDPDGNEVIVHAVVGDPDWRGDETLDPTRTLLSELHQGTFAEYVAVPRRNVVPKPPALSFEEAACLPTAWLTAYRMIFVNAGLSPGQTVLVQGASGGVASAAIALARAAGLRVWATTSGEAKRSFARNQGAHDVFETGSRLPERVDAVIETVGEATWRHSLRSLKPGGTVVVAGATSGPQPPADLTHVFFRQLRIVGSTMGTRDELLNLVALLELAHVRPPIDHVYTFDDAHDAFRSMLSGNALGKIVLVPGT